MSTIFMLQYVVININNIIVEVVFIRFTYNTHSNDKMKVKKATRIELYHQFVVD